MTFRPLQQPVDHILLAGQKSPGIAVVSGASSPRTWDERRGYAQIGARVVFRGIGLAKFTVTLSLFSAADWDDWHDWRELVQRPPVGERARAKDIWHPVLEDLGISAAVVEDVGQPEQGDTGEWTISIKFIEYRPPIRLPAESVGASEDGPSAFDRQVQSIEAQLNIARAVGARHDAEFENRRFARAQAEAAAP